MPDRHGHRATPRDQPVLQPGDAFERARTRYRLRRSRQRLAATALGTVVIIGAIGILTANHSRPDLRVETRRGTTSLPSTDQTTTGQSGPQPSSVTQPTTSRTTQAVRAATTTIATMPSHGTTPPTERSTTTTTPRVTTTTRPPATTTTTTTPRRVGDINGDGYVGCKDLAVLQSEWQEHGPDLAADLNHDDTVDAVDLSIMASNWTGGDGDNSCQQP